MRYAEVARNWGTTADERLRSYACDTLLPDYNEAYYRGVTILADAEDVFPWLCQLRVAPYSYDWIDNLGKRSPRQLNPELQDLAPGQLFMTIFELVDFEPAVHITLRLRRPGVFPPLAVTYLIERAGEGRCRLLVKLAVQLGPGLRGGIVRRVGPWLDWIMMRRQLLNLKALAERPCSRP